MTEGIETAEFNDAVDAGPPLRGRGKGGRPDIWALSEVLEVLVWPLSSIQLEVKTGSLSWSLLVASLES